MKRPKSPEGQVVLFLQGVESGKAVREVRKAHRASEGTIYIWKRKYVGMETQDVKGMRELEAENAATMPIVADQALIIDVTGNLI